jgi:hypothetical protein
LGSAGVAERLGADAWVAAIAPRQRGLVTRRQMLAAGITTAEVRVRLERGQLQVVHAGVYAVGHRRIDREGRWLAAVLACGRGAALSYRSAGRHWGLLPAGDELPEVTRPTHCSRRGIVVHRARLRADEVRILEGIPVTSVPRTIVDLAAVLGPRQLERAWNEMEVRGLRDPLSVAAMLARHPGKRGTAALRQLIANRRPADITRNDFEEGFLALVDRFGLPRPRMNAHIALRGRFYEVDCLWECQRVVVELDGGAVHATWASQENDRERDRILIAEGFRTPRVTWRQMCDSPTEVAADLARILG